MGNVKKVFNCTEFSEDTISFDGHTDDDYILVEMWTCTDGDKEYNNIGLSKKELIGYVKQLEEVSE